MRGGKGDGIDIKNLSNLKRQNRKKQIPKCLMMEESCSASSMHGKFMTNIYWKELLTIISNKSHL